MPRKLLVLVLFVLAGCTERMGECQQDSDCQGQYGAQAVCEPSTNQCFVGTTGSAPEVDAGECQFQCAPYEACTTQGCAARFAELRFTEPTSGAVFDGGTAPVPVTARLEKAAAYAPTTTFPSTLDLRVVQADGGTGGVLGAVTAGGDGTYSTQWTPPAGEADYVLTAAFPADGGPSATVGVRVDTAPPVLVVTVPTPQPAADVGGFVYADPDLLAFRRDETVRVTVESSATDVDPASLALVVRGLGGGDVTDLALGPCAASTAAFCRAVDVPLWRPGFNAFRGNMAVQVTARDTVGNTGSASGAIPVTRWRWSFDGAGGNIRASPAIGERGTIYFGTPADPGGKVFALNPNGTRKWPTEVSLGAVVGSPALGAARAGNEEYVYLAATGGNGTAFYALKGSDGTPVVRCPSGTGSLGDNVSESSLAVGSTSDGTTSFETGVGVYTPSGGTTRIVALRPDVPAATERCVVTSGAGGGAIPAVPSGGTAVAMLGEDLFFGTSTGNLVRYPYASNTVVGGWPVSTTYPPRALALVGTQVYGAAASSDNPLNGAVFSVPQTGGAANRTFLYPATPVSRAFGLAIGAGNLAFFGAATETGGNLVRLDVAAPASPAVVSDTGVIRAAPVLGRNSRLYTVTADGRVGSWAADTLSPQWGMDAGLGAAEASPALDCLRDDTGAQVAGSPLGMLYVAAGRRLYALLVDSPALDTSAPWPKFQRDARNSGNPAGALTSCQVP
jgi:hypothetical protein